ncbi:MAG: glycosyltransferase family 1 protein, partial [Enterovirga sp.]|nr:glycosyltransferase family 1 protein [Enterovirga sp.]
LAYARRFLTEQPGGEAVAVTYTGARLMPAGARRGLLRTVGERWREEVAPENDPVLARVKAWLGGAEQPAREAARPTRRGPPWLRVLDQALRETSAFRWRAAPSAPQDAIYLHTSHLRLDLPESFAWLETRPDIRPVFFVHDLIPIDFPEYVVPGEDARHRIRMATIARHAAAVIANSQDVADRLGRHLATEGLRQPRTVVAPLGVESAFLEVPRRMEARRPYFVVCSTIEARKNHLLLLHLWRDLAARLGPEAPALVIVGRRGWESEAAIDLLDRCRALRGHVIEAPGISTHALAELVAGARALLMPSFAEGYGIPVVEALAVGTPVIASDIAAHREVAGREATFLDPTDGPGWRDAVLRLGTRPPEGATGSFVPPTWAAHFGIVDGLLADI